LNNANNPFNFKPGGNKFLLFCIVFAGTIFFMLGGFWLLTGFASKAKKHRVSSDDNFGIIP